MLKINDLNKLKITSLRNVIHFKYDNEFYFIHENNESTYVTSIYKGRNKDNVEHIKSIYGFINNLIIYKHNKKVLSAIDKENFVEKLYASGLIETDIEDIIEKVNYKKKRVEEINEKIYKLNRELYELRK